MILPIYLAWAARTPLSEMAVARRLQAILHFLHLDDRSQFDVQLLAEGHGGLAFIDYAHNPFAIPLCHRTAGRLSVSAYLPFGAGALVSRQALRSGEYLPELLEHLRSSPKMLLDLAPPQVFCDLDISRHRLTLYNDWRGFGRLYEYQTAFGTIWSNKMAAALIFAGVPARLDASALADMAACGMFSGAGTGYENLRLAEPASLIDVETLSGKVRKTRWCEAPNGLMKAPPAPDAVEQAYAAICAWMCDLAVFHGKKKLRLSLSGGRDSRVVGAALLASGLDHEITVCSPPVMDGVLAERLLRLAGVTATPEKQARRKIIEQWYSSRGNLSDIAAAFLRNENSDISVKLFFSWPSAVADGETEPLSVCGDQGEVAHNCYYTPQLFAEENAWLANRQGPSPSTKRLDGLLNTISVKSFGVTPACGRQALTNIRNNVLALADDLGLEGCYRLDFLCLSCCLNRQWPGANGAYDHKTPLTVYPYVQHGFNQTLEDKISSRLVRGVAGRFLPAWRDVPFFHELPQDTTEDFYVAYPTYWEMGRGEELLELCETDSYVWRFFDKNIITDTFMSIMNAQTYACLPHIKTSNINTTAQKILWIITMKKNLDEINMINRDTEFDELPC